MFKQLVTPNLNITYTGGWCEKGVENAFGTNGIYSSAMVAADNNILHAENPPNGLYVPIYIDEPNGPRDDNDKTEGDVAISCPDGSVAACAQGGVHIGMFKYPSLQAYIDDYTKYNGEVIYRGWGEYVGKIKIVEEEIMIDKNQVYYHALGIYGDTWSDDTIASSGLVGTDYFQTTETMLDYANKNGIAYWQYKQAHEKQVADLTKQLSDEQVKDSGLAQNVSDLNLKLNDAQTQIKALQTALDSKTGGVLITATKPITEPKTAPQSIKSIKPTLIQRIIYFLKGGK
jgi:hypothetical protein